MTTSTSTTPTTNSATVQAIAGIHHVTGITADMQASIDFYTKALGLRLVKMTINYDDPGSYHVYYGDGLGRPGTILTFFGWPQARRGTPGTGQVIETAYAIPTGSAQYWQTRLAALSIPTELVTRFDQQTLTLHDPDGMPLALVEADQPDADRYAWRHTDVPAQHAIRAFFGVTLAEESEKFVTPVLVDRFGYREVARHGKRIRYQSSAEAAARVVDVVLLENAPHARMGAGQIHHVAFRTPDDATQAEWLKSLHAGGYNVSPVMNRDYFHSIYFRELGGTLFEIATDGPGMTINESPEDLGTRVQLPNWLEPQRTQVEAILPPVKLASRVEGVSQEEGL